MFKIGDKVVCIFGAPPEVNTSGTLKKDGVYIIQDIKTHDCGSVWVNVGAYTTNHSGSITCTCGSIIAKINEPNIFFAKEMFRKIKEKPKVIRIEIENQEPIFN